MKPIHLARLVLTFLGFAVFGVLALGSKDDKSSSTPPTPPEVVGQEKALAWAKSTSTDLATKLQEIESERNAAQSEVYRLDALKRQFPEQEIKITGTISEWQQVVIQLDSVLTAVEQDISEAYVVHHVEGRDQDSILGQVYNQWKTNADQALAFAKNQREKSRSPDRGDN